jgi:6-phosphogluconate dehydrogenase
LSRHALATIWRGGCIIRARFPNRIRESLRVDPDTDSLLLLPTSATPWQRSSGRGGR